jgi:hypothetical protein
MEEIKKSVDVLGIAPYGEAIKVVATKTVEGISSFLGRICNPVADEIGLTLRDSMQAYRLKNLIKIVERSQKNIYFDIENQKLAAHPRIVHEVIENGSWNEDETLQGMWSGMLAASCTEGKPDDSNILYINALKSLTTVQAKIIAYICTKCIVTPEKNSLFLAEAVEISLIDLQSLTLVNDITQLDAEMDSLRAMDLVYGSEILAEGSGGFIIDSTPLIARLNPTAFLLILYARCNGFVGDLAEFYKKQIM